MMRPGLNLWLCLAAFPLLNACEKEPEPQPEAPVEIPDPNFLPRVELFYLEDLIPYIL